MWRTYFVGKLVKLAVHPITNFIVTEAIGRLDKDELKSALDEVGKKLGKAIGEPNDSHEFRWLMLSGEKNKVEVVLSVR